MNGRQIAFQHERIAGTSRLGSQHPVFVFDKSDQISLTQVRNTIRSPEVDHRLYRSVIAEGVVRERRNGHVLRRPRVGELKRFQGDSILRA